MTRCEVLQGLVPYVNTVANLKPWRQSGVELFPLGLLTLESVMPDCPERPQCLRSARFGLGPVGR